MEKLSGKPVSLQNTANQVQEALDLIDIEELEELQKLSYSRAAGEDGFTLADSRCLLDKAAAHLYDARSEIFQLAACEANDGGKA